MLGVLTTVYPAVLPFLEDFLGGLKNQTDGDFVLFIVNDGVEELGTLLSKQDFEIRILAATGTPAALRRQGIDWAEGEDADWIIFIDVDDVCGAERIAQTRVSRDNTDGLFNDLIVFGNNTTRETSLLSTRFRAGDAIGPDALVGVNFLGLTNTAAKANLLRRSAAAIPDDVIAFDWALYTRMILDGATLRYLDGAPTRYRQHDDNVAGPGDVSDDQILRSVGIKARHYDLFRPDGAPYDQLATDFAALRSRLDSDASFFREYCGAVRENSSQPSLWWEPMKLPKELGL